MTSPTIRRANAADLPGVLRCLEALAQVGISLQQAAERFRWQLGRGIQLWVAAGEGGEVVGTATLTLDLKLIHDGSPAARVEDVAVRADKQGQGVGSALVRRLVEEARAAGAYKLTLSCTEVRASFYERLGFRRHEIDMRLDLKEEAT